MDNKSPILNGEKYKIKNLFEQYIMGNEQLDLWGWTNSRDTDNLAFVFSKEKADEMIYRLFWKDANVQYFLEKVRY